MREEDRVVRLLTLASFSGLQLGGGSMPTLRSARLRSTALRLHVGTGLARRPAIARKKRKHGWLHRLHVGKLLKLAGHFIPGGGLLTSLVP